MSDNRPARCQSEVYPIPRTAIKNVFQFKGCSHTRTRITGTIPIVSPKSYQETADKVFPTIARFQPFDYFLLHVSLFFK
jgi:hypothetical protein